MARVVGFLAGLVLLIPAMAAIYIRYLGGSAYDFPDWFFSIALIGLSPPMLAACTLAGVAVLAFTIHGILRDREA